MNILFFIQILLELIPISSSAHLSFLTFFFTNLKDLSFNETIIAHIPTAIAQSIFIITFFINKKTIPLKNKIITFFNLIIATFITAFFIGFSKIITNYIPFKFPIYYGLLITTIILFSISSLSYREKNKEILTFSNAIYLGIIQSIALLPGISRFAITILGTYKCGMNKIFGFVISIALNAALSFGGLSFLIYSKYKNPDLILIEGWENYDYLILALCFLITLYILNYIFKMYKKNYIWYLGFYEIILTFIIIYYEYFC